MIQRPVAGCYPARRLGRGRQRGATPRARTDIVGERSEMIIEQMQEKTVFCDWV
jgi:hypothetical protein